MKRLFILAVVCLLVAAQPHSSQVYANEVLKVTRDHFEFRDAPRVGEETLIGTLRIDTPVEWTGNVSGSWFEVKAPNGLIGWVHESGLSRPKTSVKQRQSPKPASSASRSATQNTSDRVAKLQATVKELEHAQKQSAEKLQEKDRRIKDLSNELSDLEEKLSNAGQMLEDQEQLRILHERKASEAENELLALKIEFDEQKKTLSAAQMELTKQQNLSQGASTQQSGTPLAPERIVLGLSLLVNLLGFLLLLVMRKRLSTATAAAPSQLVKPEPAYLERPEEKMPQRWPSVEATSEENAETEAGAPEHHDENDERLKELDIVMDAPYEDVEAEEEVEIDLGDVLPAAAGAAPPAPFLEQPEPQRPVLEPKPESEPEPEMVEVAMSHDADVIVVEEPIARIEGLEDAPLIEAVVEELPLDEEPVTGALIEELPENRPESIQDVASEPEELLELEEAEAVLEELTDEGELGEGEEELLELEGAEELDAEVEEGEELPLENAEWDEETVEVVETADEGESYETPEKIEVSGESFEKLPQSATQRIESEEDEDSFQEELSEENGENGEMIIGTPGIIDEDDYENETSEFESSPETEIGSFEPGEDIPDTEDVINELAETEAAIAEYPEPGELAEEPYEFGDRPTRPQEFEVEEIVLIDETSEEERIAEALYDGREESEEGVSKALYDEREEHEVKEALDISSEVEELLDLEESGSFPGEPQTAPSFLEPSPYLIEPESEPEEPIVSEDEAVEELVEEEPAEEVSAGEVYDIELLNVGSNKDNVIRVLSKVNGLAASPKQLVENTPCLMAKGAGKEDAESFQLIMQKLGATVRLLPQK